VGPVLERLRGGGLEALVVMGHELLHEQYLGGVEGLEKLDTLVVLDTHHSALERVAHVVIPTRHLAEKSGHVTNHAGLVQVVEPAVEPAGEAIAEAEAFGRLARLMAGDRG
jgi:predicted molibdopterin-dependent oxidoreductase YjgC